LMLDAVVCLSFRGDCDEKSLKKYIFGSRTVRDDKKLLTVYFLPLTPHLSLILFILQKEYNSVPLCLSALGLIFLLAYIVLFAYFDDCLK
jgi:hypothetical protein